MLETALKSNPAATPAMPGRQQDKEIQDFDDEVWTKIYKIMDESSMVGDDSDDHMDNIIDLSEAF